MTPATKITQLKMCNAQVENPQSTALRFYNIKMS